MYKRETNIILWALLRILCHSWAFSSWNKYVLPSRHKPGRESITLEDCTAAGLTRLTGLSRELPPPSSSVVPPTGCGPVWARIPDLSHIPHPARGGGPGGAEPREGAGASASGGGERFCLPRVPRYLLRPQRSAHPRGIHRRQLRGAKERPHAWKHLPCSPSERCPRSGVFTAPGV